MASRNKILGNITVITIFYILAAALLIGILGYRYLAGFSWVDSFLNASMILGGMGPASELTTTEGKIFASLYAIFSGAFFLGIFAIILDHFLASKI